MKRYSNRSALTLVEVLVVVAIVGLVAALVFPVYSQARRQGHTADAIAKTRQVVAGLLLYKEDFGAWPDNHVWEAVKSGHLKPEVMLVRGDPQPEGLAQWIGECERFATRPIPGVKNSFESVFYSKGTQKQVYLRLLAEKGETNPALVAYRGLSDWQFPGPPECFYAIAGYQGRVVRGRADGSVKVEPFFHRDKSGNLYFCPAGLFTSLPDHSVCDL